MIRSSPAIGIGITTKNRWQDLAVTLTHLRDEGLDCLQTIVIDDGSDRPAPPELARDFPWVKFERFEKSEGMIPRRNRLAARLTTEFYLSLDDDSFPVAGDLEAAANWLRDHPKVAVLTFRIIGADEPVPMETEPPAPILVTDFLNGGALIRRDLFLKLGGLETRLHFYHEEPEYALRTFLAGYDNYAYLGVVVRHIETPVARPQALRARYFIRNVVLIDLWFFPFPRSWVRAFVHLPFLLCALPKPRHYGCGLLGWLEGFVRYPAWRNLKPRLSMAQLREWKKRPIAVAVCMGAK